jgi:hypothetical protein
LQELNKLLKGVEDKSKKFLSCYGNIAPPCDIIKLFTETRRDLCKAIYLTLADDLVIPQCPSRSLTGNAIFLPDLSPALICSPHNVKTLLSKMLKKFAQERGLSAEGLNTLAALPKSDCVRLKRAFNGKVNAESDAQWAAAAFAEDCWGTVKKIDLEKFADHISSAQYEKRRDALGDVISELSQVSDILIKSGRDFTIPAKTLARMTKAAENCSPYSLAADAIYKNIQLGLMANLEARCRASDCGNPPETPPASASNFGGLDICHFVHSMKEGLGSQMGLDPQALKDFAEATNNGLAVAFDELFNRLRSFQMSAFPLDNLTYEEKRLYERSLELQEKYKQAELSGDSLTIEQAEKEWDTSLYKLSKRVFDRILTEEFGGSRFQMLAESQKGNTAIQISDIHLKEISWRENSLGREVPVVSWTTTIKSEQGSRIRRSHTWWADLSTQTPKEARHAKRRERNKGTSSMGFGFPGGYVGGVGLGPPPEGTGKAGP